MLFFTCWNCHFFPRKWKGERAANLVFFSRKDYFLKEEKMLWQHRFMRARGCINEVFYARLGEERKGGKDKKVLRRSLFFFLWTNFTSRQIKKLKGQKREEEETEKLQKPILSFWKLSPSASSKCIEEEEKGENHLREKRREKVFSLLPRRRRQLGAKVETRKAAAKSKTVTLFDRNAKYQRGDW